MLSPKSLPRLLLASVFSSIFLSSSPVCVTAQSATYSPTGASNKCLDVVSANFNADAVVDLYDCNGTNAQSWSATGGSFQIQGYCLTAASSSNGAKLTLQKCNGSALQQFTVASNGEIQLPGGFCVDVTNNNFVNGNQLQIWQCFGSSNQVWKSAGSSLSNSLTVSLSSKGASNMCIDVVSANFNAGTVVDLYDCNGTNAQFWTTGNNQFQIQGYCLAAAGSSNGAKLSLQKCNGNAQQQFTLASNGEIQLPGGFCVDVTNNNFVNGNQLQIWQCSGNSNQVWSTTSSSSSSGSSGGNSGGNSGGSLPTIPGRSFNLNKQNNVIAYWGNSNNEGNIDAYCNDDAYDVIIASFLCPFGNGQGIQVSMDYCNGNDCSAVGTAIKNCQAKGKTVLISLGGGAGSYGLSSTSEATSIASELWNNFLGGSSSSRPFGDAVFDGIDLDIEKGSNQYWSTLITSLRSNFPSSGRTYYTTAAPQCPFPDAWMGPGSGTAISSSYLDWINMQFYNNGCGVSAYYGNPVDGSGPFNYQQWSDAMGSQSNNPNIKIMLGVAASSSAGDGYVSANQVGGIVDSIKQYSQFAGVMMWAAEEALENNGFGQAIRSQLTSRFGPSANVNSIDQSDAYGVIASAANRPRTRSAGWKSSSLNQTSSSPILSPARVNVPTSTPLDVTVTVGQQSNQIASIIQTLDEKISKLTERALELEIEIVEAELEAAVEAVVAVENESDSSPTGPTQRPHRLHPRHPLSRSQRRK